MWLLPLDCRSISTSVCWNRIENANSVLENCIALSGRQPERAHGSVGFFSGARGGFGGGLTSLHVPRKTGPLGERSRRDLI